MDFVKFPFYSIGHANRAIDEFVRILSGVGVGLLVDVRSVPRSRTNPQFNGDVIPQSGSVCRELSLSASLRASGIEYLRIPELGGFRAKSKTIPFEVNGFWTHNSFHSYADYAMGQEFKAGLDYLIEKGKAQPTAFMCAEMLWWRCHRRIITDYLLMRGQEVYHIIGNEVKTAKISEHACLTEDGNALRYPV